MVGSLTLPGKRKQRQLLSNTKRFDGEEGFFGGCFQAVEVGLDIKGNLAHEIDNAGKISV